MADRDDVEAFSRAEKNERDERFSSDTDLLLSDIPSRYRVRDELLSKWRLGPIRLFFQMLILSVVAATSFWLGTRQSNLAHFIRETSEYSPGLEAITREYHTVRFNGRFGPETSEFKGPPSPKVNKEWSRLSGMGVIRISDDEFKKMNSSIHSTKLPASLGGGYMGLPEFVHQIHCVELLWKASYGDYYSSETDDDLESDPKEMHDHLDHCADILRQKAMCDADVGIITYNWRKNHYRPHPNFNVQHKCRDFDAALQWALDRQVDASVLGVDYFTRPDHGVVEFDEPPFDPFADE